ncbi:ANR family transcriptional regulator [Pasteurellaceae bacterium 22721_9_1]
MNPEQRRRFDYYSRNAAENERQGRYMDAMQQWSSAARIAQNPENRNWCQARYEWCHRMITRPYED